LAIGISYTFCISTYASRNIIREFNISRKVMGFTILSSTNESSQISSWLSNGQFSGLPSFSAG